MANNSHSSAKSLAAVTAMGDREDSLKALRDRLAREIDAADHPRDVAALSSRLTDVLSQLAAIENPKASKRDELAKKRTERQRRASLTGQSDASDSDVTSGDNQRR